MEWAIVFVAAIGYAAFRQYLRHHRRIMIHRERVAAIEKGIELPPLEAESKRTNFNVQRVLLLFGLVWIVLGVTAYVVLSTILNYPPTESTKDIPHGIQLVGIAPVGIGIAHLITYWVGSKREE